MQETFHVAASDDRVMIQKRKRNSQLHRFKMERFFNLADKSSDGAIDIAPWRPRKLLGHVPAIFHALPCQGQRSEFCSSSV